MAMVSLQEYDLIAHGVSACQGCGVELIIRNVLNVVGEDIILVIPPGCAAMYNGFGNEKCIKVASFQGNLENSAACASGISRALRLQGNDHTKVVVYAGDGATVDIGLQSLSGMIERGDNVLYICYDNEAYMNTGIQGSSSTPFGAWTTTTPGGKNVNRKDLVGIAMAHNIPYCASCSIANLPDLRRKIAKAKEIVGPTLIHVHCPCPTGWGYSPEKSIEVCRNAVQSGAWVLYECENGKLKVNVKQKELKPISEYLKLQKRFKGMSDEEIDELQAFVSREYEKLLVREG